MTSSTGLSTNTAAVLAYAGWWVTGVILWLVALWKVSSGDEWRIPVAADLADRLLTASATGSS